MKNVLLLLPLTWALGWQFHSGAAGAAEGTTLSPRIRAITPSSTNWIVSAEVPAGAVRAVLESTEDAATGPWRPRATMWLRARTAHVQFTIPTSGPLGFLRVRADDAASLPLPTRFYQGPTSFPSRPIEDLQPGPIPAVLHQVFGVGAVVNSALPALGPNLPMNVAPAPAREVVESDLWRVDGRMVYTFHSSQGLQVIDLTEIDAPVLRGTLRIPGTGDQLYLLPRAPAGSDRALALLTQDPCASDLGASGATVVQVVRIERGTPHPGPKVVVPGRLLESRLVGEVLYVVTDVWTLDPQRLEAGLVIGGSWSQQTRIASVQLARPNAPILGSTIVVTGAADAVQATDRRLYVAMTGAERAASPALAPGPHRIKVFDISDVTGTIRALGTVPTAGRVTDKFKIHENGDVLSVVSFEGTHVRSELETWSLARPRRPRALARLPIVAGENLFATRFDGTRLYVVTFRRVDPLWILDLSDPAHPSIQGELQVPGWSTYLHPLGDRLLAMGVEDGRPTVSLFDVARASAPRLASKVALTDRWGFSEANETEKAFTVLPDQGLLLVPLEGTRGTNQLKVRGTQLVDFDRDRLTTRGLIDHRGSARRAAAVDTRIVSLSATELLTVDASDRDQPRVRGRVELRQAVDRVWVVGSHLIQLARGETTDDSPADAELRVTTQAEPTSALMRVPLPGSPVVGESLHDGRLYLVQGSRQTTTRAPGDTGVITNRARLTLTVFDATRLPDLPAIAQTAVEPHDYFGDALTALWPNGHTLVWRTSGSYPTVIPFPRDPFPMPVANPLIILPAAGVAAASPQAHLLPWFPWWVAPPPRLFAIDLTASTPRFVSDLVLAGANQASYGAMFAFDGQIYAGRSVEVRVETPATNGGPVLLWPPPPPAPRRQEVVPLDFRQADRPTIRPPVQVPGQLIGIARQGTLWFTIGPPALDTNSVATHWHALAYDGSVASLVDSLPQSNVTTTAPLISRTGSVLVGESGSGAHPPRLVRWELPSSGRFRRAAEVALADPAVELAQFHDLLTVRTTTHVELRDGTQPNRYGLLSRTPVDCTTGINLGSADGSQAAGLWLPRGDTGLDHVPVTSGRRSR